MSGYVNAARVIAKRKLFEVAITPGYYIALSLSLSFGFLLVYFFTEAIGSSGFAPAASPVYDVVSKSLAGLFGETFVDKLFAEGPYFFALFVSFLPILIYLAMSSAFRFGFEKNVGAIELLAYGPADGTSYFLASIVKDLILTAVSLVVLLVFFGLSAVINNLVLGPLFFFSLIMIIFFALAVFSYCIFASVVTDSEASSVALLIAFFVLFTFVQIGSFALISGYVRNLSSILGWIVQWISPVFYWQMGLDAIDAGQGLFFAGNLLALTAVSCLLLLLSHFILKKRGIRA
jgi:hypothetical protein